MATRGTSYDKVWMVFAQTYILNITLGLILIPLTITIILSLITDSYMSLVIWCNVNVMSIFNSIRQCVYHSDNETVNTSLIW